MSAKRLGCLALLGVTALASGWCWKGPVVGRVVLAPEHDPAHAALLLRCRMDFLHGETTVGESLARTTREGRFRIAATFRGPFPKHCALEVYHPLYVSERRTLRGWAFERVDEIELVPWAEQLERGGEDYSSSHPWPEIPFRQHLANLEHHHARAFASARRAELRRYLPELRRLTDEAEAVLIAKDWRDPAWGKECRRRLQRYQDALGADGT